MSLSAFARGLIVVTALAWTFCVFGSLVLLASPRPGVFLQGLARTLDFVYWQAAALVAALIGLAALAFVQRPRPLGVKLAAVVPMGLSAAVAAVLALGPMIVR